jgi:acetyltransferase-like isoleucine patch superfamily enzyme
LNDLSPIVLFAYNRPEHTLRALEALRENELADQSVLYIYCDGPKAGAGARDLSLISEVRSVIRSKQWCREVHIVEQTSNKGLADSIIEGVTEIINRYGKIIVLEDDLVTGKGFLSYMNKALELYKDEPDVMHISGYIYPSGGHYPGTSTVFLKILSCWGWATWKRAWSAYNHDIEGHIAYFGKAGRKKKFNIEGHADYYEQLLLNQSGRIYSWAVRWYASWLRAGGISLFPGKSLVQNTGFDNTGVHSPASNFFFAEMTDSIEVQKIEIKEDGVTRKKIDEFYSGLSLFTPAKPSAQLFISKSKNRIQRGMKNLFRKLIFKIVPELSRLEFISHFGIGNSAIDNTVKLYEPYQVINCSIGAYTYLSNNSSVFNTQIGRFCSIGPNFICGRGIHSTDGISTSPMFYSTLKQNGITLSGSDKIEEFKNIVIGNDVLIGMNVVILDGVRVGDGAVIGAGAVVNKDIPPYAIAAGVPAKVVKYRFREDIIEKLLKIKWWNWDIGKLREVEVYFHDIEQFVDKYSKEK